MFEAASQFDKQSKFNWWKLIKHSENNLSSKLCATINHALDISFKLNTEEKNLPINKVIW